MKPEVPQKKKYRKQFRDLLQSSKFLLSRCGCASRSYFPVYLFIVVLPGVKQEVQPFHPGNTHTHNPVVWIMNHTITPLYFLSCANYLFFEEELGLNSTQLEWKQKFNKNKDECLRRRRTICCVLLSNYTINSKNKIKK